MIDYSDYSDHHQYTPTEAQKDRAWVVWLAYEASPDLSYKQVNEAMHWPLNTVEEELREVEWSSFSERIFSLR